MKRWILLLLVLLLVCPAMAAQPPQTELDDILADYMAEMGLNENNFSLSYYNTVTGEQYAFNDKKFMVAASTFKLPLNMYYYEMEWAGEIEPDAYLPKAGVKLDVAHELSMVDSNNEVSIGMLYSLGDFPAYKEKMRKYFTMAEDEIDYIYYADNYYCTHMMMDALKYLYEHQEDFGELIGYMKRAQQDQYFCAGVTDYEVAHKYGWFDGAVNDVGIIYTEQPFLLAVYTQDVYGEGVVADVAALVTEYNAAKAAEPAPEPEGVILEVEMIPLVPAQSEEIPEGPAPEVPVEATPEETAFVWWMIPVALCVFLLGGSGTILFVRRKNLGEMLREEEAEE